MVVNIVENGVGSQIAWALATREIAAQGGGGNIQGLNREWNDAAGRRHRQIGGNALSVPEFGIERRLARTDFLWVAGPGRDGNMR